ncbi:MAG: DUF2066 domain-containing protein [Alphaproteobacteria bacterium]|nr:DUF2066 domain-containing protein [Alphaproteobacteria bacterium]
MKKNRFCFSAVLTVLFFMTLSAGSVRAAPIDTKMFSASGIQVDVTAGNAAAAREQAMQDGQKRALMVVMERITPSYVVDQLPELVPDDILNFVQDISVLNEKTSSVRYMATLEVRFNPDAVRELLRQNGLPYVRTSGKPLLILPVYKRSVSASPVLWAEDNAWLRAWVNRTTESYMVPLFVPMGELSDLQTVTVDQILNGDLAAAQALAKRYEAEGILIVELIRNGQTFTVKGRAMDEMTASEIPNFSFSLPLTKNTATTFSRAVKKVVEHLESVWKSEQMVQFNEAASLVALVPVSDLKQWEKIKGRLDRIPIISSYYMQAARAGVLQLTIFFAENLERLQKEMNKRMLSLSVLPSGVFKLTAAEQVSYMPSGGENPSEQTDENTMMPAAQEKPQEDILP